MAPDQFSACLQELQARLCDQHPSPTHVSVLSLLCGDIGKLSHSIMITVLAIKTNWECILSFCLKSRFISCANGFSIKL